MIFGVPRSGTSWIGQIFNSSPRVAYRFQPLFSYEFKDALDESATAEEIARFHTQIADAKSDFVLQTVNVSGSAAPSFRKRAPELLVWKEVRYLNILPNLAARASCRLILVARHPCAVVNSWLRAPREFRPEWRPEEEWQLANKKNEGRPENYFGYERWKSAMRLFVNLADQFPERTSLLRYEDVVREPLHVTEEAFALCGLPLEQQTRDFLEQSTASDDSDPYGVSRQSPDPDRWRYELDDEIRRQILADLERFELTERLGY